MFLPVDCLSIAYRLSLCCHFNVSFCIRGRVVVFFFANLNELKIRLNYYYLLAKKKKSAQLSVEYENQ